MEKTIYLADDQKPTQFVLSINSTKMGHPCWMLHILVCSLESIILVAFIYAERFMMYI